jgi:hypothetical protein
MGSLKPGATYVYEKADGVTYAREMGADPSTRKAIGWDYNVESTVLGLPMTEVGELIAIYYASLNNPSIHEAFERVKILYHLSKDAGNKE